MSAKPQSDPASPEGETPVSPSPPERTASPVGRRFARWLIGLSVILLIPAVPFLLLGEDFEQRQTDWLRGGLAPRELAAAVAGLLAADIFLPVPSTSVSTYAGAALGWGPGIGATWLGLTAGCLIGFALARWCGRPFAERFARGDDLAALDELMQRYGLIVLVVSRALPLLAEAAVLLTGLSRLSWRVFLFAIATSNLAIAAVYVAVGVYFRDSDALPWAIVASGTVPLLLALALRKRLFAAGTAGGRAESNG